jgi:hypothetical protein
MCRLFHLKQTEYSDAFYSILNMFWFIFESAGVDIQKVDFENCLYNWSKLFISLIVLALGTVSLGFITIYSNDDIQVVRGSVWLVRTVKSKAYLRKYNVVGARWCIYK